MKNLAAWGSSKLLELYVRNVPDHQIRFVVDSYSTDTTFNGLPVKKPADLQDETVVIFAVSTTAVKEILGLLHKTGRRLGHGALLYSELFRPHFNKKCERIFGKEPDASLYDIAVSQSLNSSLPVHTTILGNVLFLESMRATGGVIAEVGAFNGGNAILASQYMAAVLPPPETVLPLRYI